jgi:signal transduction histidine kinase
MFLLTLDGSLLISGLTLMGAAFTLGLYHLFLYLQYKEKIIFYYSLYLIFITAYIFCYLFAYYYNPEMNYQFIYYAKESMNVAVIISYSLFLAAAVSFWKSRLIMLFRFFNIIITVCILYCIFYLLAGVIKIKVEFIFTALPVLIRTLALTLALVATRLLFPKLQERFLRLIKWGAVFYLVVVLLIMISFLNSDEHLLGIHHMQLFFIGTFVDIIIFSMAMSYKVKSVFTGILALRNKISQDLHDDIGSSLSSIHIYSSVASRAMQKENEMEKAKEALDNINENARRVMENMSDIVWAIHAGQLGASTLESKLKNYGYDLLNPLNIQCAYFIDKEAEKKLVNLEARKNLLLIAREAMNNIAKYSEATRATVKMELRNGQLLLEISDNGKGITAENRHNGHGLNNMQQRAAALGGRFECLTDTGLGTRIRCVIPIANIRE